MLILGFEFYRSLLLASWNIGDEFFKELPTKIGNGLKRKNRFTKEPFLEHPDNVLKGVVIYSN